jgi:hypothetical protein
MNSEKEHLQGYESDPVNHPHYYTSHPSGLECIQVTRHMSFNLGNVVKYLWRADLKGGTEDLKKAAWYLNDEIEKRERAELVERACCSGCGYMREYCKCIGERTNGEFA